MELTALVRFEGGSYWAEVKELPGCFASGGTLDELNEALAEAVSLYHADKEGAGGSRSVHVEEMKLLVSAAGSA